MRSSPLSKSRRFPEEGNKFVVDRRTEVTPTPATTSSPRPSRQNKPKDLFAPREEEGFSLISHLDLDSELDLDMDLHLDQPAFPKTATPAPVAMSSRSTVSAAIQHKVLDSSLPFFFPQKGHVRSVGFTRMEGEAEIHARWEAARGELTREWKRRLREAAKSLRRRGGEHV